MTRLALTIVIVGALARAQGGKTELYGVVRDASGGGVPGALVEAVAQSTLWKAQTQTAPDGAYYLSGLVPGRYTIRVRKERFRLLERTGIEVRIADRAAVDLELKVGELVQTMEVSAAAPLLKAAGGSVSYVVEEKRVVSLPLDGRNFIPLIALQPGVSLPPGSFFPRINGSRPRVSEYLYDGISVLQPEPGQVVFYPVVDAIEELRITTSSYSAEYGRANGGVIQVSHKSGANGAHGTAFEFLRNEALNARNYFAGPGAQPRFRRNQYGFALGGPVVRNKTFFFGAWQGTRLSTGVVRFSTVPAAAQRNGVFTSQVSDPVTHEQFADGRIPESRWDPAGRAVLARYPLPSFPGLANNYRRVGNEDQRQDQASGRVDHLFSSRHRVFGRYEHLWDTSVPVTPLADGSGLIASGTIGDTATRADAVAGEHAWNLRPSSLNQLRAGFTRRGLARRPLVKSPVYAPDGFQQIGPTSNAASLFTTSVTQVLDTLSVVRGRHSLKIGADVRHQRLNVQQPPNPLGLFRFTAPFTGNSVASLLLGAVESYSIDFQDDVLRPRANVTEFFLQDDWKASPRLSLNTGVRYTLNFPSTEANDRGAVFDSDLQKLRFLAEDGYPRSARDLEWGNLGPRVGLAWRVRDDFVLRSGYGLVWFEQAGITTPFTTPQFPFLQTVTQPSLDGVTPAFLLRDGPSVRKQTPGPDSGLGQGVFAVQRGNGSGYAQQWNFTMQKTIGESWSLEAAYLGSKLTRLGVPDVNLNQLSTEQLALGARLLERAPNPFYGEVPRSSPVGGPAVPRAQLLKPFPRFTTVALFRNNIGHSTYHSLQTRVERRFLRGLTFTAAYTFSKLIDDASAVFDAAVLTGPVANVPVSDARNRRLEKDLSQGDMPHVFSAGFVWEMPRAGLRLAHGWTVAGMARMQSGVPVAVTQNPNYNAFAGFGSQRPNRVGDPDLLASERSASRWFRTEAFLPAPQFAIGNSSRNPVRGPGYRTVDLMAAKTWTVRDRLRLEFRVSAFNVTNSANLGNPNGTLGSASFGTIASAFDPRVFEMAVKVGF